MLPERWLNSFKLQAVLLCLADLQALLAGLQKLFPLCSQWALGAQLGYLETALSFQSTSRCGACNMKQQQQQQRSCAEMWRRLTFAGLV